MSSRLRVSVNKALWVGQTTAVAQAKGLVYKAILDEAQKSGIADFALSLDNQPSSHSTAGSDVKRNAVVLKSYDNAVEIELMVVDVKASPSNTIVRTALLGRPGSVKEFIQANDYKVSISGSVYTDSRDSFPLYELKALDKILKLEKQVQVANVFLQLLGITKLVFESGDYMPSKKHVNAFDFSLNFISDEDYDLYVEE
jgi:hypothetical protein